MDKAMSQTEDEREGQDLVQKEAALLDDGQWAAWIGLYARDCWYWAPHRPDQPNPFDEVSIFYDDRMLMETRVRRLTAQNSHAQSPPTRTSRVLGQSRPVDTAEKQGADTVLETRFTMAEYRLGEQKMWAGKYTHGLRRDGDQWQIAWKRVDLVNADAAIDGISIPF